MAWRYRACDGFGERLLVFSLSFKNNVLKEEFKEEEEPQEEEDDMEVEIEEDENEPYLTYPYEEVYPLNPSSLASDLEPEDVIDVEDTTESEDETVPASVPEVGESSTASFLQEDSDGLLSGLMRIVEQGTDAMEKLVEKLGNAEEKSECKKLKKELEEARFSNTFLRMQNERVERDLYRTRVQAHEFYREMIHRGFVFEERPNESVDVVIAAERARHANAGNDARGSGSVRVRVIELQRWFEKTKCVLGISECVDGKKNNQKQGNARTTTTAPTDGKVSSGSLPVCECCFTRHVGQCTIKCHKCGKVGHKARYCKEKNVATGANAQPFLTCYDYGELGHTRKQCLRKSPSVVTGSFLLNNRYASVLFDSGSDMSFMDTRFSSMLDIDPIKIDASYEVELVDGRVVSTNIVLKGCTLNLVNHLFEIDLMPIKLGTFNVIIGIDWLVKHDAIIVCGEKVFRIPYENKMLIVKSDKGVSRLKAISCIKARKYVERGCHLFLARVTEKKSKKKRLEYVPIIRNFPEVFPDDLLGLPPPRQ
nr:hypothetical protein [Tanacetum cinerariifolium]